MKVTVQVSDPWQVGEAIGWQPLVGQLLEIEENDQGGRALIKLDTTLCVGSTAVDYLLATVRHEGDTMSGLRRGIRIPSAIVGINHDISRQQAAPSSEVRRGRIVFIGDIAAAGG